MKTVGQKVTEFRITGVKPGFNRHEENGQSAFEDLNEKSFAGKWKEALNSDAAHYGGSNVGNVGEVHTLEGSIPELSLTIPPLAAIFLVPES